MPHAYIEFFGLRFHWYGLIIGVAVMLSIWISYKKAASLEKKIGTRSVAEMVSEAIAPVFLFGLLGGRMWHVITDWSIYSDQLLQVLYVWQGGMSILGALLGGLLGWTLYVLYAKIPRTAYWLVPDLIVLGLPFGQALGRVGNWINQELYGLPSTMPWAVQIAVENRVTDYAEFSRYHPLFAYEAIASLVIGMILWLIARRYPTRLGSGWFVWLYLLMYATVRFFLDFLRINRSQTFLLGGVTLGINQIILLLVLVLCVGWLLFALRKSKQRKIFKNALFYKNGDNKWLLIILAGIALVGSFLVVQTKHFYLIPSEKVESLSMQSGSLSHEQLLRLPDRSFITVRTASGELRVEVVNTPESITQGLSDRTAIGSDGMLFVLPASRIPRFWMVHMRFGLDLVWITDQKVLEVTKMVKPPNPSTPKSELPLFSPKNPVNLVLEVEAGSAEALGLQSGATVWFENPSSLEN